MAAQVIRFLSQRYGAKATRVLVNAGFNFEWEEEVKVNWLDAMSKELVAVLEAR